MGETRLHLANWIDGPLYRSSGGLASSFEAFLLGLVSVGVHRNVHNMDHPSGERTVNRSALSYSLPLLPSFGFSREE